jgi:hypothetical protein
MAEDKKKNRLSMVKVRELSIVDRPANKSTFLLFKRDDGGGEVTNEELQKAFDAMKAEKEDLEKKVQELEETITKAKVPPDEVCPMCQGTGKKPAKKVKKDLAEDELAQDFDNFVKAMQGDLNDYFDSKNESVIQSAYDALGGMLEEAKKRKKKKPETNPANANGKDNGADMTKVMEEYNEASPEKKKEMEAQAEEMAKSMGIKLE